VIWLVIFVALMIPLTAVVLDSPVIRDWVTGRRGGETPLPRDVRDLTDRVEALEAQLEAMNRDVAQLQEAQQFTQKLLENPDKRPGADKAPDRSDR
jgi:TolA-binding protein